VNQGLIIATLGEFIIQHNGEHLLDISSRKAEALLVYLAVERGKAHRWESLYTLLWPGMPEKSARHNLSQALYALRQAYERVMLVAGNIQDDDLRRSYLENVRENREILKAAKARGWCD
jgi:DNA-binding SARP family transcriptional activator